MLSTITFPCRIEPKAVIDFLQQRNTKRIELVMKTCELEQHVEGLQDAANGLPHVVICLPTVGLQHLQCLAEYPNHESIYQERARIVHCHLAVLTSIVVTSPHLHK